MKKKLEKQAISLGVGDDENNIRKEILFHNKMITIWEKNYEKIKKELKKIDN